MSSPWQKMAFSDAVEVNPRRPITRGTLAPFVDMASLPAETRDVTKVRIRPVGSGGSRFTNGDTLFARITPCTENGKTGLVHRLPVGEIATGSTEFIVLGPRKEVTIPQFVYYLAKNPEFRSFAISRMRGTSGRQRVPVGVFDDFEVCLPPLPEQRKIAAILSSVEDAIAKTRAVIDQVQVVKRGLMQELLTRGLPGRHTQFKQTELGEIPEEWGIVRIIDVADVDYGISAAVSSNTDPDIGWPILTGANLTLDGQIDLFKLVYHEPPSKERFQLRKNDLLLNWRSGSLKHVGKTALFDLEGNYTYASFVLRIRSRGKLVPGFGHVLLNFMRNAEFFSKDLSQQVNFKMNAAVFREILIRLPSVGEQEEIALTAARFDSRRASEAQSLAALQKVKAALMSVLLTGELRVTLDTDTK